MRALVSAVPHFFCLQRVLAIHGGVVHRVSLMPLNNCRGGASQMKVMLKFACLKAAPLRLTASMVEY